MKNIDLDLLSDIEKELLQYLYKDYHKLIFPFLREHGKFFKPSILPMQIFEGNVSACYENSYRLLEQYGKILKLMYVEGYAVSEITQSAHLHAWYSDPYGNVYDPTWWDNGLAYFGVAFKTDFLMSEIRKREKKGDLYFGLLDDWHQKWPVICQLANRPEVWKYEGKFKMQKPEDERKMAAINEFLYICKEYKDNTLSMLDIIEDCDVPIQDKKQLYIAFKKNTEEICELLGVMPPNL